MAKLQGDKEIVLWHNAGDQIGYPLLIPGAGFGADVEPIPHDFFQFSRGQRLHIGNDYRADSADLCGAHDFIYGGLA